MGKFDDKIVVVTGGTSGIGAECARQFCIEGAQVIITGRNAKRAAEIINHVQGRHKIEFIPMDMNDLTGISTVAIDIKDRFGGADVLINNAGIYPDFGRFEESAITEWKNVIDVNVLGMAETCRAFMGQLSEKRGVIINNSSIAGMQEFTNGSGYAYAASKAAIIKFTKMLAKNYAKKVRINCICPGVIDTPIYLNLDRERMIEKTPAGRLGEPKEVASVVLFLASEEASYIYGAVLPIDGGMAL